MRAAAEGDERACLRRSLDREVLEVRGAQKPQASASRTPVAIQIDQHRDQFRARVGVDRAVGRTHLAADRGDGRPAGKIDPEFLFYYMVESIAVEFHEQLCEVCADAQ